MPHLFRLEASKRIHWIIESMKQDKAWCVPHAYSIHEGIPTSGQWSSHAVRLDAVPAPSSADTLVLDGYVQVARVALVWRATQPPCTHICTGSQHAQTQRKSLAVPVCCQATATAASSGPGCHAVSSRVMSVSGTQFRHRVQATSWHSKAVGAALLACSALQQ